MRKFPKSFSLVQRYLSELPVFKLEYYLIPPRGGSKAQPTAHASFQPQLEWSASLEAPSRERKNPIVILANKKEL